MPAAITLAFIGVRANGLIGPPPVHKHVGRLEAQPTCEEVFRYPNYFYVTLPPYLLPAIGADESSVDQPLTSAGRYLICS